MAKVYLDTNYFIDLFTQRQPVSSLDQHHIYTSPLNFHILAYVYSLSIPNTQLTQALNQFNLVPFNQSLLEKALQGPTEDLEDNIQLHSSAQENCTFFLTRDQSLLKTKYFGQSKILDKMPHA